MERKFYVTKISGEKELFSIAKYQRSLRRAGCTNEMLEMIMEDLLPTFKAGISTKEIYQQTWKFLKERDERSVAGRYNLKQALLKLGPSGYPFEHFVASILKKEGYKVNVGSTVNGFCVTHEVDVLAESDHQKVLVECKFHNKQEYRSNVKIPLYVKARLDDVNKYFEKVDKSKMFSKCFLVTNTKFTSDAIAYGECVGLNLISWGYPKDGSLEQLIQRNKLHPITCLNRLTQKELNLLLQNGIVLCSDLKDKSQEIQKLGLSKRKAEWLVAQGCALEGIK
ncbi:TPA: ATPase [Candidatus Dependentiae bacterium]|nr:MAG: Restriction endonuclease [candidate division TM6 bacterium GW2011_GWE2_31_21]KKP53202.1 MAG: Restriction endonuclease [candidate division TM6 bacterium GW2011_GWF2_33_332]HBS48020.1 ATPase [Candidatus Dependentiae bacterium]HBZ73376.1 ATPase [Candidatus Dependentiae bacterium]